MHVSVLITCYNNGQFIDHCIRSALSQTWSDVEIIVYDDGSEDNSLDIISNYRDRISLIAGQKHDQGHCFNQINAISRALEASSGDIICLLDGDDAFLPMKVEKVVAEFNDKSAILVQHPLQDIDARNDPLRIHRNTPFLRTNYLKAIYFSGRLDKYFMPTSGLAFRRKYLEQMLPIHVDDYNLLTLDVRLTREAVFHGQIRTLDEKLGQYRKHSGSYTTGIMTRDIVDQLLQQMYDYFNGVAGKHGYPALPYSSDLGWRIQTNLRFFIFILISPEAPLQKLKLIYNFFKRMLLRRSILRSYGIR